jgi:hypothetical protein
MPLCEGGSPTRRPLPLSLPRAAGAGIEIGIPSGQFAGRLDRSEKLLLEVSECHGAAELCVFAPVNHTRAAAVPFPQDSVVRNSPANHCVKVGALWSHQDEFQSLKL